MAAYQVKRGDTYDHDCSRTSHRLRTAQSILAGMGLTPEWSHSDSTTVEFGRTKHCCDYRCKCEWPEWVTDEIFEQVWALADSVVTKRGEFHHRAINAAR